MADDTPTDPPPRQPPAAMPTARPTSSGSGTPKTPNSSQGSPSQNPSRDGHEEHVNEQSPLLQSRDDNEDDGLKTISPLGDEGHWVSREGERTRSSWYMFLLTFSGLGLQIGWSVEMSNGSPYLLSLGMSKAILALVWLAGPLSGVLVQPFVGLKSDRCRIKWGRRRPFMIGGAVATIFSLLVLAWTREIVGGFLSIFGVDYQSRAVSLITMILAVIFVYVLDFAINVLQAASRAFVVDSAPTHQQDAGNAWLARQLGMGNIIGMLAGGLDLPKLLPFLGNTQFKVLCAVASIVMFATVAITCASISERDPTLDGELSESKGGLINFFKGLYHAVVRLPPQVVKVCEVQFIAWIGWFPFLFYITTYIGEIYVEPIFEANPNLPPDEVEKIWERGTRRGTFALLIFSIVTFASSVILPFIVQPTFEPPKPVARPMTPVTPTSSGILPPNGPSTKPTSNDESRNFLTRLQRTAAAVFKRLRIPGLTLRRAWLLSHLLFAVAMFLTFLVRSVTLATILVGIIGIPWALTMWAPFALISAEISKRDAIRRGLIRPPHTREGELLARGEDDNEDQAGVVLGIHNVSISAPQVIATVISSIIFKIAAKPRGSPGDESVAWCLRFGGLCALGAAWLTRRVGEENDGVREVDAPPSLSVDGSAETERLDVERYDDE